MNDIVVKNFTDLPRYDEILKETKRKSRSFESKEDLLHYLISTFNSRKFKKRCIS